MAANDSTWTDEMISTLCRLWDEGHATAEIGRRLRVTKNAVVGKAHRLVLPPRPSPIRRGGQTAPKPAPRSKVLPSLPPLPSIPARVAQAASPVPPSPMLTPSTVAPRRSPSQPCCWPLGEPGRPGFRFCNAPADGGKPYCAEHRALAYVRPPQPASARRAA